MSRQLPSGPIIFFFFTCTVDKATQGTWALWVLIIMAEDVFKLPTCQGDQNVFSTTWFHIRLYTMNNPNWVLMILESQMNINRESSCCVLICIQRGRKMDDNLTGFTTSRAVEGKFITHKYTNNSTGIKCHFTTPHFLTGRCTRSTGSSTEFSMFAPVGGMVF